MNLRWYEQTTLARMQEHRYRTSETLRNGWCEIPAGTEVKITGKRSGLSLSGVPCSSCGVKIFINRVPARAIEMIR